MHSCFDLQTSVQGEPSKLRLSEETIHFCSISCILISTMRKTLPLGSVQILVTDLVPASTAW